MVIAHRKGQAFLTLVFLIGGIIATVALTLSVIIISSVDTSYGSQASNIAETVATAGAQDALLQLTRTSNLSKTSAYTVQLGSNTANVTITQNSPATGDVAIFSTATVSGRIKNVQVIVTQDPITEQVIILKWADVQ